LAPFDTELVARAISAMPVPVLTGIGHETDSSVADLVAHSAHKTPTACAHALVGQVRAFLGQLDELSHSIGGQARRRAAVAARELDDSAMRIRRRAPAALNREVARLERDRYRLDRLGRELPVAARRSLDARARRVVELGRRSTREAMAALDGRERALVTVGAHHLSRASLRVDAAEAVVRALDPRRVLERGYTITRDEQGRVVRRITDTGSGAVLVTELADGHVASRVERVMEDGE
ncbi:MAG TPA: exodeoxyribonuclease VII large subunit, partial [Acidimicrobiia bacterium]